MQSLMVLGRQPDLGLAELESLYGTDKLTPIGLKSVIVDVDPCILAFDRLGGSTKFCKILTSLDSVIWKDIEKFLIQVSPDQSQKMPEGKMRLGLSAIGFNLELKQMHASGLALKKAIKKTGRNVRYVPNNELELNSAQIIHNQLTGPTGWELVIIRNNDKTVIAQTVKTQDIDRYARRDRERPKRDARVGMLPPKLAQIIINLAAGKIPEDTLKSICDIPADQPIPVPILDQIMLDPFCGSGVIIQEAMLMGYGVIGTDIDQRMVNYTKENIEWLADNFPVQATNTNFKVGDATSILWPEKYDFVASEAYLGRPFTSKPDAEILAKTMSECNLIIKKFLQNIHKQIKPGTRLCIAVPAWQIKPNDLKRLPLIDQIEDLGYNSVSFQHASQTNLTYYRQDQIVARQMLVIIRK